MSYFNELTGGPTAGHSQLLGSNIDWGQDLLYFRQWLDRRRDARPMRVALWSMYDPRVAGIEFPPPPPGPDLLSPAPHSQLAASRSGPFPGWYALSVNEIRSRDREYSYFLLFQPVATAGYSIYIYHITLDDSNRVRKELGLPELAESRCPSENGANGKD